MIQFTVPCIPVAQPRPRATLAHGGKGARMHEVTHIKNPTTGERKPHPIAAFKASMRHESALAYSGAPLAGALLVRFVFVMPRPSSMRWSKRPMPRAWHTKKPDAENIAKAALDALTGLLWIDDAQVVQLAITKVIASGNEQPSVSVEVEELDERVGESIQGELFGDSEDA